MTPLQKLIAEMRARTERNANLRSDDFGHDTQALLVAESEALQVAAYDLALALDALEVYERALEFYGTGQHLNYSDHDVVHLECEGSSMTDHVVGRTARAAQAEVAKMIEERK